MVNYFECPEEYEKLGYEDVYAITARFGQNSAAYQQLINPTISMENNGLRQEPDKQYYQEG